MVKQLSIELADEPATGRFAEVLERCLPKSATVVLSGTLGAGKTRLVQNFAVAAGVDAGVVTSPTFVLCQHYEANRLIHHVDAYRFRSVEEFVDIGGVELLQDEAICFVEWGERIADVLPDHRLEIRLSIRGETQRTANVTAHGEQMKLALERLADEWSRDWPAA